MTLPPEKLAGLKSLLEEIHRLQGDHLALPMPKRLRLPAVAEYRRLFMGNMLTVIEAFLDDEVPNTEIVDAVMGNPQYAGFLREVGISRTGFEVQLIALRFEHKPSPVMTLRTSLNARLEDMGIGKSVPVELLRPPYPVTYIEFGPAEDRATSPYRAVAGGVGAILEGAYVAEHEQARVDFLRPRVLESLKLDPEKPARVLEISFTGSPLGLQEAHRSVAFDQSDFLTLYIQDESEPLVDVLERHLSEELANPFDTIGARAGFDQDLADHFRHNVRHLMRALLYIMHRESRTLEPDEQESALRQRLDQAKEKKRAKLERQLNRTYDRVLLGPDRPYTPIKDLVAGLKLPPGTKAPHYRIGYYAVRWVGSGEKRRPEVRRVKPSLVNFHLVEDSLPEMKDYDVR